MVPVASAWDDKLFEPALGDSPFHYMMDGIFEKHSAEMVGALRVGNTKMRREPGKRGAGRSKIPTVLLVFYNLEYDIQRLFNEDSEFFSMARINVEGLRCTVDGYEIENVHMVLSGSAPHFTWIIRSDNHILRVMALDLWGYMKGGLAESAKALGIIDKLPMDKEWFHIPLEELTDDQLNELRTYAKRDAKVTRELYRALLYFLIEFSPDVVTKKGVLPPSAPAAAARIAFSKMEGETLKQPPKFAVQMALEAYNGGMVFCNAVGEFKHLLVGDRNSAYPTMMSLLPDPEKVFYILRYRPSPEDLIGKIGFCRASFTIVSDAIPFITSHIRGESRSNHAQGRYDKQTISIYELEAGHLTGCIKNITIHEAVYLKYDEDACSSGIFYDFVQYFHQLKNENEKGSALYLLSKLLMNALYGKLIEMRNPEALIIPDHVRRLRIPSGVKRQLQSDKAFRQEFFQALTGKEDELEDILRTYQPDRMDVLIPIHEVLQDMTLTAGTYFFPFYASLITAGQRAWMSVYTYYTQAVLADTDSAFSPLSEKEFVKALEKADAITSQIGVGRCRIGKELGDIDIELRNAKGYIAGIKQYALSGVGKPKIAHHAITAPGIQSDKTQIGLFYKAVIHKLANHESVSYRTKSKPVRIRTALMRGQDYGLFQSERRTITPKDDPRMVCIATSNNIRYYRWRRRDELC